MKNWIKVLISQFASTLGTTLCEFAILVWIYKETNSSFAVSLLMLSFVFPKIIISPFAAYLVDRLNRKRMLQISEVGEAIVCIAIIGLSLSNRLSIGSVIIINLLVGITESFRFPAYSVITSSLLPAKLYAKAHGLYMIATSFPAIIGPTISAYMYEHTNIATIYLINLLTLCISIFLIATIKLNNKELEKNQKISMRDGILTLKESLAYIGREKEVLYMLLLCAFFVFSSNVIDVLLPVSILSSREKGIFLYGNIETLFGIGGLLGAIIVSVVGIGRCIKKTFALSFFLSYLGMFAICYQKGILICGIGIVVLSIFSQAMDACCQAWWQTRVPIMRQGQVFAIRRFVIWSFGCIGTYIAGLSDNIIVFWGDETNVMAYALCMFCILLLVFVPSCILGREYILKNGDELISEDERDTR